jgi:hypothetical protein
MDRQALDAGYNNSAAVADSDRYLAIGCAAARRFVPACRTISI